MILYTKFGVILSSFELFSHFGKPKYTIGLTNYAYDIVGHANFAHGIACDANYGLGALELILGTLGVV